MPKTIKNWILNNFWIKLMSLVLAVLTWFYVNAALEKEKLVSVEYYKTSFADRFSKEPDSAPSKEVPEKGNKGYLFKKR